MRKTFVRLVLVALVALFAQGLAAQDATPEATPEAQPGTEATPAAGDTGAGATGEAAVTVANQIALNGIITLERVASPGPGFVAVHVDLGGTPGPLVGIASVPAGESSAVPMLIDTNGATPALLAMLHADDNTTGVFEYGTVPGADQPVTMQGTPFTISAITAYPQQPADGSIVVASAIHNAAGWVVIHADENGQPGAVLGQAPIVPGTNTPVIVPVAAEGQTAVVWPMLHVDDGQAGVYEFGTVEGADAPIQMNGTVAMMAIDLTSAPTVLTAVGIQIGDGQTLPELQVSEQALTGVEGAELAQGAGSALLTVDVARTVGQGWVDVHADGGGHPGKSLGMALVPEGDASSIVVELNPMMQPTPPFEITPVVWPMLHIDDANPGVYDYLMIPGADLPIVLNGRVVTLPVNITGGELVTGQPMPGMEMMMTPGMGGDMMATPGAEGGDAAQATATPAG